MSPQKKSTPKTISVSARLDPETYKKFQKYQRDHKIQVKSHAAKKIITEYLEFTKEKAATPLLQQKKKVGRALLSDLSNITLKIVEFESKLRKELNKK